MDVRGLVANGLQQDEVQQLLDRVRFGELFEFVQVDTLVSTLEFSQEGIRLDLVDQFGDVVVFRFIILGQGRLQRVAVRHLGRNGEAHQGT